MGGQSTHNESGLALSRIFLWLNSGCNSRCLMCDIWKNKDKQEITVDDIRKWASEWASLSIPTVVVCGEPLLYSRLWEVCEIIRSHGIRIELLTNGYLLDVYAKQVANSCDVVRVSLDGPEPVHNKIRGVPGAYQKLKKGVQSLRNVDPGYSVGGRCAVHKMNFRHLRQVVEAARDLDLSSISFSGTDISNEEAFKRYGMLNHAYVSSFLIEGEDLNDLERELDSLKTDCAEDFRTGFISDSPEDLDWRLLGYYRGLSGAGSVPTPVCNAPWNSAIIEYDGTVRPCFPMKSYGNISEHRSLVKILNSRESREFRDNLNVATNPICQRCVCPTYTV